MRLGMLVTSIGDFGQKGFYNAQDIGLAKELDNLFNEVIIYKIIPKTENPVVEKLEGCNNTTLKLIPFRHFGSNGFVDFRKLDTNIDVLVYFSDTQIMVPKVYKWCEKYNVKLIPYIGVVESHSNNKIKKLIIDKLFKRNIKVYNKCLCMVKTPSVGEELNKYGIKNYRTAPVGLDVSLLSDKYRESSRDSLKGKWGFKSSDKILLFIGRLVPEKQPLKVIELFEKVYKFDSTYRLLIVGNGVLNSEVEGLIIEKALSSKIQLINKVPNVDIWELFRMSDTFINLNTKEIFGMAILEAMFYECKVVAWAAPGPNFIIENGVSGRLCESDEEVVKGILTTDLEMGKASNKRVLDKFTWKATANEIYRIVNMNTASKVNMNS